MNRKTIKKKLSNIQTKNTVNRIDAVIGDMKTGVIKVKESDPNSLVYVTIQATGQVMQAKNNIAPAKLGFPVVVGVPENSRYLHVLEIRDVFSGTSVPSLPDHSHTMFESDNPTFVRGEQFLPGLPAPIGGMEVRVFGFGYFVAGSFKTLPHTTIDFSSYVPTTGARWVTAEIDSAGTIHHQEGTTRPTRTRLTPADIPTIAAGRKFLFALKTYVGQTSIVQTKNDTDIYDPRFSGYFDASGVAMPFQYVDFDTEYAGTAIEGRLQWNADEGTLDIGLPDDVVLQVGQEVLFNAKNQTGATIEDGTPVMFAGTLGASGRILIQKAIADDSIPPEYTMGIVTHDIADGEDGKVTWFGKVRGVDTTGTPYGETWADGDLIYISPDTAGYLTNVKPSTPDRVILVAAVIHASANGTLMVRPSWTPKLDDLDGVSITSPQTKQVLVYDGSEWVNDNQDTQWIEKTETWTRTGDHTFTVSGDVTAAYRKAAKVRYKQGGSYEYGVIYSSSYSAPNTTVTLIANSDYAMAAATVTDAALSYIDNPEGFPPSFNFSTTVSANGSMTVSNVVVSYATWQVSGIYVQYDVLAQLDIGGTPNTQILFTVPAPYLVSGLVGAANARDDSTGAPSVGRSAWDNTNQVVNVFKADASNWTLGTARLARFSIRQEF